MKKVLIILAAAVCSCTAEKPQHFDLLIRNAVIYDGKGNTPYSGDLGIEGEKIVAIGDLEAGTANEIIDAMGMAVTPGFIDMHAHLGPLMQMPLAESHVRQGCTTALGGPDGGGPWPLPDYLSKADSAGIGLNVAYLIGHNSIRRNVIGMDDRAPTSEELETMKNHVNEAMEAGAFGISTGLKYLPGTFAEIEEVIELSKVAARKGGIYTSHLREEGLGLLEGVQEAITISREADIPVVLTHHKAIGIKMWGASTKTLAMVDSARALGLDIMMDQYPYAASHTGISVIIPAWALEGNKFKERTEDPLLRDSIKAGIVFNILNDRGGSDLKRIQFSRVSWREELEGKTMHDWAVMEGLEPTVENGAELVIQAQLNGGTGTIYHAMDEGDVENIMRQPMTMTGSDARLSRPGEGHPHPRAYGTFPRILGHYVREKKLMPLETALHKMTGLPASRLGITDRGTLEAGNFADIVIFDPETIIDKSTFTDPHQYPEGIHYVIINGQITVRDSEYIGLAVGKVLRSKANPD